MADSRVWWGPDYSKRLFDLCVALTGLILTSPLFVLIAIAIRLDSKGPVIYRGRRIGLNGAPFELCKFRTMIVGADRIGPSSTTVDDHRLTRTGTLLRSTKLDELPQLLNVIRGEMSLVGPRPQVEWAVARYDSEARRLLSVRPGITDYASIRFKNEGEILAGSDDPDAAYLELIEPEKIRLGLAYVDNQSLMLDIRIIFDTLRAIVRRSGG